METLFYEGHKYQLVTSAISWNAAKLAAEAQGGHLATIQSSAENSALSEFLLSSGVSFTTASDGGGAAYVWLGATDSAEEGNWQWVDGTEMSVYTNWGSGIYGSEPDNFQGSQDAMAMGQTVWPYPDGGLGSAGQWNDINENNDLFYLIEWDQVDGVAVNGSAGIDTQTYTGNASEYTVAQSDEGYLVTGVVNGNVVEDELISFERITFDDRKLALDLDGNAGTVAKTLGAVFGADAVSNLNYARIGLQQLDNGMSGEDLMGLALNARLGADRTYEQVVDLLYANVVGVNPSDSVRASYVALLETGAHTEASLGVLASDTGLNLNSIDFTGLQTSGLAYAL